MGHSYQAVGWNRQKKIYDITLVGGLVVYILVFVGVNLALFPYVTIETALLRALGTGAFLLLHVVLCIGPAARLNPVLLPLLYNRRHLGVATFVMGLAHGGFALFQFHALGDVNPIVSVLISNPRIDSISQFPFQPLGVFALLVLFLMASTSHDFWLVNLTAPVWKALHMMVYVAYGAIVAHVALGVLQAETDPWLAVSVGVGMITVFGFHLAAGWREKGTDRDFQAVPDQDGFVDVGHIDEIVNNRGLVVTLAGERVAVFKYDGKVSCISNVCQHQNGPLGEGKIIDGFVTCPWHGYQYCPDTGASPAPFTEQVPTFRVKLKGGRILVNPEPQPAGTRVEPAAFSGDHDE
jgi:sulfoxide reductase heme-binding subunit YedZ